MADAEVTFAEAGILHLTRAMRELAALGEDLAVADEHMMQAEQLMLETRMPPKIIVINENAQSIGVSLVNTNEGVAIKISSRGGNFDQLLGPGKRTEVNLSGC